MSCIRKAIPSDAGRLSEIEVFDYRLHFYPLFRTDAYFFSELNVPALMQEYRDMPELIERTFIYDDGVVKGFVQVDGQEVKKLFVEPVLQGKSIGAELLTFAVTEKSADFLWALEKNTKAIRFYTRHGFRITDEKKYEEGTTEYLVRMER